MIIMEHMIIIIVRVTSKTIIISISKLSALLYYSESCSANITYIYRLSALHLLRISIAKCNTQDQNS